MYVCNIPCTNLLPFPFIYKSIIISFTLYPHVEKSICIHAAEVTFKKALLKQIKNDTYLWNGIQVFVKEKKKQSGVFAD